MEPIRFRESNQVLMPPAGAGENVLPLHVMHDGNSVMSCWELNDEDIEYILEHKKIWLRVMGNTHPPLWILAQNGLREDIADFTQVRIRAVKPIYQKFIDKGLSLVMAIIIDGKNVWESEFPILLPRNGPEHRKQVAEIILWILCGKNSGISKLYGIQFYDTLTADPEVVPDLFELGFYIKTEKYLIDLRNNNLTNNAVDYMFLES